MAEHGSGRPGSGRPGGASAPPKAGLVSSRPSGGGDHLAPEEMVAREAVADFTRSLVQTMNRTTYYESGHPAHYAVRDELYVKLMNLLVAQPQIGYLLMRGTPPEVYV